MSDQFLQSTLNFRYITNTAEALLIYFFRGYWSVWRELLSLYVSIKQFWQFEMSCENCLKVCSPLYLCSFIRCCVYDSCPYCLLSHCVTFYTDIQQLLFHGNLMIYLIQFVAMWEALLWIFLCMSFWIKLHSLNQWNQWIMGCRRFELH
jgi:hypothetical protein